MEIWKEIKDSKMLVSSFGNIKNPETNKILKPFLNSTKHQMIEFNFNDGKRRRKLVSKLVAETFLPNPDNKSFVHHNDHDVLNNRLENLVYKSNKETSLKRPLQKNNTSGCTGVTKRKGEDLWTATIKRNGIVENLGTYNTKEKAISKRLEAEEKYLLELGKA
jgi:hypothetical protein